MIFLIVGVNFDYHDPERGFDRSKVKGVVAKLVHLQDLTTTTALEVAAGGKLYQVLMLCPCSLAGHMQKADSEDTLAHVLHVCTVCDCQCILRFIS